MAHVTCLKVLFFPVIISLIQFSKAENAVETDAFLRPTVVVAFLVRNKAHTLPWFLGHLEMLAYPKDRISLWIRSDHNIDNSTAILKEWIAAVKPLYHSVDIQIDEKQMGYTDESSPFDWTEKRFSNVITLRQKAIEYSKQKWADYLFMIDADVIIENRHTLQLLQQQQKLAVGPMLNASVEGYYSNFWGAMNEKGYYERSSDYIAIVDRRKMGCFSVPMVHSAVLFDMRRAQSKHLSYSSVPDGYEGPKDDIIILAHNIKVSGETMHVLNNEYFGKVMIPLDTKYSLQDDWDQFDHVRLEANVFGPPLPASPHISFIPMKPKEKLGFDQIYMINLERRSERRERMMNAFDILGIDAVLKPAVDGKKITPAFIKQLGIQQLPGYADPYSGRSMTMGEIGCFLSHYYIWEEVVQKNYSRVLLFEDDIRFEPYFLNKLKFLMYDLDRLLPTWDLVYLGRKRLRKGEENLVEGSERLAWPHYSYWTLSYAISNTGAQKLLNQKPLTKLVPVDEYLPIMFDRHPEDSWKQAFWPRNLLAVSADPFLVYPTHYTGESNYISDTEDSAVIENVEDAKMRREDL
ncbi:procollagen galactosyltransferase 1-like [Pomacea canaliculata]|uniref:procollagen galactosyltransferase 1-like n=1 Tax=Pomacea canaliculata TaxID=400727 RepID=UPI000D734EB7|nr:procollagen galactosyltransferase 1-like [Pomacea canaliculata]